MAARNYSKSLNGHSYSSSARRLAHSKAQRAYRGSYCNPRRRLDYDFIRSNAEELSAKTISKFNSIPEIRDIREGTIMGVSSPNCTLKDKIICSLALVSFMVASILTMFV